MKKAIIVGASSGIGYELAYVLAQENYILGFMGRRIELLQELQRSLSVESFIHYLDLTETEQIENHLSELMQKIGDVDLVIISSNIGYLNEKLEWQKEKVIIDVNVLGFLRVFLFSFNYFSNKNNGHIVRISSISALRGNSRAPAYNASKAYISNYSNYMEGIRCKLKQSNILIFITDVRPGFVDTKMAQGDGFLGVAPPREAARQIYQAIKKKKKIVYVTHRWKLIALIMQCLPEWLLCKMG